MPSATTTNIFCADYTDIRIAVVADSFRRKCAFLHLLPVHVALSAATPHFYIACRASSPGEPGTKSLVSDMCRDRKDRNDLIVHAHPREEQRYQVTRIYISS